MKPKIQFTIYFLMVCSVICFDATAQESDQPKTVSDYLQILQTNQVSIQDYSLVVSKSNSHPAYSEEEAQRIVAGESQRMVGSRLDRAEGMSKQQAENIQLVEISNQLSLANHALNGSLYELKGIGQSVWKYAFASLKTPYNSWMRERLNQKNDEDRFDDLVDPFYQKWDVYLNLKQIFINGNEHSIQIFLSEKMPVNETNNLFELSQKAVVMVEDPAVSQKRFFAFPFLHEEFLVYANESNTSMNALQNNLTELTCHSLFNGKFDAEFSLICDSSGTVYEYKRIVEDTMQCHVKYFDYTIVEPGEIKIPSIGTYWNPEIKSEHSLPVREGKETCILLYARTNIGYTLEDLHVLLPAGSTVKDQRSPASLKEEVIGEEQKIHLNNVLTFLQ